jgi:hypothetical protein
MTNERLMLLLVLVVAAIATEVGADSPAERVGGPIAVALAFAIGFGAGRLVNYLSRRSPG